MREPRFHVGDRVQFQLGRRIVQGVVKEDRGPIGVKGRRLYAVVFPFGEGISRGEFPAVELELVPDTVSKE